MKYLYKIIIISFLIIGYVFNIYFLTVDPKIRDYQWVNKVGVLIIPLGSVMGLVYALDKSQYLKNK
jgi:cytochrome c oxidase assembly factor CtaG